MRLHRGIKKPAVSTVVTVANFRVGRVGSDSPNVWGVANWKASSNSDKDTTYSISGNFGMRTRI